MAKKRKLEIIFQPISSLLLIGSLPGKIIDFDVRNKGCRHCQIDEKLKKEPLHHDCRKHWGGTAKAMESDMIVSMLKKEEASNVNVLVLANDSTTMARVREEIPRKMEDVRDLNHTKKNLASHLYELHKKYPSITTMVVEYLQKCLAYAITGDKGDAQGVRKSISNTVSHASGNHKDRGEWCGRSRRNGAGSCKTLSCTNIIIFHMEEI